MRNTMLRSLPLLTILAVCAIGSILIAGAAKASIPAAPPWGSSYQLVFSQDYTTMTALSQVGISSGTTIGLGQTWVPTRIPASLNWNDFIYTSTNNDPFGIDGSPSYLDIRAQDNGSSSNGFDGYTDGILGSMDGSGNGFAQEYGYFECDMWTPGGPNTWPAFWLLDKDGLVGTTSDSVEIDISESYGNFGTGPSQNPAGQPDWDAVTWHWWNNSNNPANGTFVQEPGMSTGYHQYGVDIEPSGITFYFDRNPIWNVPADTLPSSNMLDRPFFLLMDLALGGGNYNNANGTGYDYGLTPNPSDLKIQYVAVWASPNSPNYATPPAAPTGLTASAGDKQVDLSWSGSAGATSYNIYRGSSANGEAATPIGTSTTASYTDTGLTKGQTYYYKVAAVNAGGTSGLSNEASATPQAAVLHTFPAGLQMIAAPTDDIGYSFTQIFSQPNTTLAVWSAGQYVLSPTAPADTIVPGRGYWVRFASSTSMYDVGNDTSSSQSLSVPLSAGWNMIGDPFASAVTASSIEITSGSTTYSLAQASSASLIGGTIYTYQAGDTSYESQPASSATLSPYEGYWIFAFSPCTLVCPAGS